MAASRLLKFPIQNWTKSCVNWRVSLRPRADLYIEVGGYIRGQEKKQSAARAAGSAKVNGSCHCGRVLRIPSLQRSAPTISGSLAPFRHPAGG